MASTNITNIEQISNNTFKIECDDESIYKIIIEIIQQISLHILIAKTDSMPIEYESYYKLENLYDIDKSFRVYDSLTELINGYLYQTITKKEFKLKRNNENIEIIMKNIIHNKQENIILPVQLKKKMDNNILIKYLCASVQKLNTSVKHLKEENKTLLNNYNTLLKEFDKFKAEIKNITDYIIVELNFVFKSGLNYYVDSTGTQATKSSGGPLWNCNIIGNKPLVKNKVNYWKIKLAKFNIETKDTVGIFIGILPMLVNQNEMDLHTKGWFFGCKNCDKWYRGRYKYFDKSKEKQLTSGDVIGVFVDLVKGTISFNINGGCFKIAFVNVPTDVDLIPAVLLNEESDSVIIIN